MDYVDFDTDFQKYWISIVIIDTDTIAVKCLVPVSTTTLIPDSFEWSWAELEFLQPIKEFSNNPCKLLNKFSWWILADDSPKVWIMNIYYC